jgi:hypothetical protein
VKALIDNLAWVLPVAVLALILVYSFWWRERPRVEGRITGDFAAARELAAQNGATLLFAVDSAPA